MLNLRSSLDHKETTVFADPQTDYQTYLARKDPEEWFATAQLYVDLKYQGEANHLEKFYSCRTVSFFVRHQDTNVLRIRTNACRLRWCPLCAGSKSRYQKLAVLDWCKTRANLKLLTLTLRHTPAPLTHQLKHLYRCFALFRKDKIIRKAIRGAIWFTQVKLAKDGNMWHPHVHMIIDSEFIPQTTLVQIWSRITRTSKIVDIRAIKTPRFAVNYVGRYAARPAKLAVLTRSRRVELALSLRGRRLAGTWGTAHQIRLTPQPIDDKDKWQPLGTWHYVTSTLQTNPTSKTIFQAWQTGNIYTGPPVEPELQEIWNRTREPPLPGGLSDENH